jgi:hypothetical protein
MPGPVGVDEPVVGGEEFTVVGVLDLVDVLVGSQVILKIILKMVKRVLTSGKLQEL